MDGIETTLALCAWAVGCAVVILSIHGNLAARVHILAASANAFVGKTGGIEPLLAAIRRAAVHRLPVSQE
jgi:DNA-binding NarL/FixJ family response regulator